MKADLIFVARLSLLSSQAQPSWQGLEKEVVP
jgi:hypothetical protein